MIHLRLLPAILVALALFGGFTSIGAADRPNILIAISDDQSFPHASAYGFQAIQTPAFDRVAREGILFNQAFAPAPGCSPMRAALLTGRNIWQLEQAGTHASAFPKKYTVYPDKLEQAGYWVGYTGKGWGPGNWQISGRERNPAGPSFAKHRLTPPARGINSLDYATNFADFLSQRPEDQPFCFWYGASEPHRAFEKGIGLKSGMKLEDVEVPPFLPDTPEIRSDILDYCYEIQWFDRHLERMLKTLEEAGQLENTIVMVTSDNGMAFPRAKANLYEYGIHMPLAIRWGARAPGGRVVDDLVNLIDLTATIYEVSGVEPPGEFPPVGKSLANILLTEKQGRVDPSREAVFAGRERHSSSRWNNWTYPQRAVRTQQYLYIRNFKPDRWPAGDPQKYDSQGKLGPMHGGYHDIDACPTMDFLLAHREDPKIKPFFHLAVDKRPAEELYDVRQDPGNLKNLADDPQWAKVKNELAQRLEAYLHETGDPRVVGDGEIWETYPRYSPIRTFPEPPAE